MTSEERANHCILMIEDDMFVKDLYHRTLQKRGYKLLVAEDGEAGLNTAREKKDEIELILLDIMLPKMNGVEVLKTIAQEGLLEDFTVVLLTNLGQESIIKEAFNMGAEGYMLKARLLPREIADQIDEFFETGTFPSRDTNGI